MPRTRCPIPASRRLGRILRRRGLDGSALATAARGPDGAARLPALPHLSAYQHDVLAVLAAWLAWYPVPPGGVGVGAPNGSSTPSPSAAATLWGPRIRDWTVDDADAALATYGVAEVTGWLTPETDRIGDRPAMRAVLQAWVEAQANLQPPRGRWAIERLADAAVVGGLAIRLLPPRLVDLEISFQLRPEEWGNGYAAEAAGALIRWAFAQDIGELYAVALPSNTRTRRRCRSHSDQDALLAVLGEGDAHDGQGRREAAHVRPRTTGSWQLRQSSRPHGTHSGGRSARTHSGAQAATAGSASPRGGRWRPPACTRPRPHRTRPGRAAAPPS